MYAYICINILWVAGDGFSLFSLAPSPEPARPSASSRDTLLWDSKLRHKVRTFFSSSIPPVEGPPTAAQQPALGGVLQRGAGQGEREHGARTSSFSPATPRGKRAGPRAWLLVANCRGYRTVVEIAMQFVTPHFNLICCGVRLEKQSSSFSILPVLTAVVTKPTFHFRHILMMDCSGMKTSHPAKL